MRNLGAASFLVDVRRKPEPHRRSRSGVDWRWPASNRPITFCRAAPYLIAS